MNILTRQQKKSVEKIYKQKFMIVSLWMVSFIGIVFLIAIAPLYFQVSQQSSLLEQKISNIQSSELAATQTERDEIIATTNNLLNLFKGSQESPREYVRKVVEDFGGVEVDLVTVNYQTKIITFGGEAETRQDFVDMTQTLQESVWAEGVEVPVSNFTKSENIPFSLSLVVNDLTYDE